MRVQHATFADLPNVYSTVVVIDVIRAFTTAAYAFAAGAREILPTETVAQALELAEHVPDSIVMGHAEGGLPPKGFDFGNSPSALIGQDFSDRRVVQRTGAGTKGLVACADTETLLAASFPCAGATVRYLKSLNIEEVTFLATGDHEAIHEDLACAKYMEALLSDSSADPGAFLYPVRQGLPLFLEEVEKAFGHLDNFEELNAEFNADLDCCFETDRFEFAMVVADRQGLMTLEAVVR